MSIKSRVNLTTDAGTNILAVLTPVLTYVLSMQDGHVKSGLIALCVIAISVDLYLIKGSKGQVAPIPQGSAEEVLEEGREP